MPEQTLKIPIGSPVPAGWVLVRMTRSAQYIQKPEVPQQDIDDLMGAFSSLEVTPKSTEADVEMV